ncbi:hypothetical protein P3W45_000880 [Vairimorpha bombi]|jgi:hypothetical protein
MDQNTKDVPKTLRVKVPIENINIVMLGYKKEHGDFARYEYTIKQIKKEKKKFNYLASHTTSIIENLVNDANIYNFEASVPKDLYEMYVYYADILISYCMNYSSPGSICSFFLKTPNQFYNRLIYINQRLSVPLKDTHEKIRKDFECFFISYSCNNQKCDVLIYKDVEKNINRILSVIRNLCVNRLKMQNSVAKIIELVENMYYDIIMNKNDN